MKKLLLYLVLICALGLLNAESITINAPQADKNTTLTIISPESPAATSQIQHRISQCLKTLEEAYLSQLDKTAQEESRELLQEIRGLVSQLPEGVGNQININFPEQAPPAPEPISEENLQALKKNLFLGMYDDNFLDTLRSVAEDHYFTVSQIASLLQFLSFSDDKDDALYVLYPRCLDKENKLELLNSFLFDSSKDQVTEYLNTH